MKKTLLSAMALSSGVVMAVTAQSAYSTISWGYGSIEQQRCSTTLSFWWPEHPAACPLAIDWTEIQPGLTIGTSQQVFDWNDNLIYSEITIQNNTGLDIPAGSRLTIVNNNIQLTNATGTTEDGLSYIETIQDIPNGESLVIRAEFKLKLRTLTFDADFDIAEISDGTIILTSDSQNLVAQVVRTLTATVSDPDGVSSDINYQWQANGVDIEGANSANYKLTDAEVGQHITVTASYIDDVEFTEEITSAPTDAVLPRAENSTGKVVIAGDRLLGSTLTATVNDNNAITQDISFQWYANGTAIEGATESYLPVNTDLLGKEITAEANYTDFADYTETPSATTSRIANTTVSGEEELIAALGTAADGDWIALANGDYADMAEMDINIPITLTQGQDSDAVISGATCIELSADKSALVGLTLDRLDVLVDSDCGDSNVILSGDNVILSHNSFLGQVEVTNHNSEYNWVYVSGSFNLVERNVFQGKNLDTKGAAITVYNKSDGSTGDHLIQYNLLKDMPGTSVQSSAYAIQIGRSTSTASLGEGNHTVRYNRFDNVQADRRLIKVQASRSSIYNNTIVNSTGGISVEDGYENIVSNNVIISAGDNSDDSGIMFSPYGHTITGNYIAGLKTTSSQRAGLLLSTETVINTGNQTLEISPVTIANNTIINSNHAISTYDGSKCIADTFVANLSRNLVANGVTDQGSNGESRSAFNNDCAISTKSTSNDDSYYASNTDFGTLAGTEGAADLTIAENGLLEGQGTITDIGADADALTFLEESDVGPSSDFAINTSTNSYNGELNLDFTYWYITFPSGDAEYNPQWLLDGNTSEDEFFYDDIGAAVFKSPNIAGSTEGSSYPRTELREMLRGPEQDPKPSDWPSTQGLTKNNWVFSNSYQRIEHDMGGVDGTMEATLKVDHVSTTYEGEENEYKVGRVIVGQIHASDDEPLRLYYHKLPGNELGSVYFASEVPGLGDDKYDMIGSRTSDANPVDGIALGEVWSYRVEAVADDLTITIMREGKPDVARTVKTAAAYANDWMYFKAGVYNQNNTGDESDYAQATFYSINVTHGEPPAEAGNGEDETDDGTTSGEVIDATSLQTAILAASAGDVVELTDGDYADIGNIVVTDGVTLTRAEGSTAVISGQTCLLVSGDDARVTGLEFSNLSLISDSTSSCRSNGDGSIVITGDNVTFNNNLLNGDAIAPIPEDEDTHNWLVVKGANTLVERNTFQNRQGIATDGITQVRGGFISVYVNSSVNNNTIQYNLFKDMLLADQSSAYAIQLGRTTGTDSGNDGLNIIQYNRFDNIDSKSRLIRVQGSNNVINHNTVVNSQGMISLEDGQFNEVNYNIILPSGSDSNDGGIAAAPYGHIIIGNYIAGSKTTSSERGAIYLNHNVNGTGNQLLTATELEISSNTIINTKQPLHIGAKGCGTGPAFIVNFSNNLIANGVSDIATYEGAMVTNKGAVRYDCALDLDSTFTGEAYYTTTIYNEENGTTADTITFDVDSVFGLDAEAELIATTNGLIKATGIIENMGTNTETLHFITEDDVGVGSSTDF